MDAQLRQRRTLLERLYAKYNHRVFVPPDPLRWAPTVIPDGEPLDFVDGLRTMAVNGDPDRLSQVAWNLLANAVILMAVLGLVIVNAQDALAALLLLGWQVVAWTLEGLLVAALAALIFGKFCLGSYVFHLLRHDGEFANRTLPWVRRE